MKILVLYFTRTGSCKLIAEKVCEKTGATLAEISDDKNWQGIWGFLKGGYYSSRMKSTEPIITPNVEVSDYDKIVVISPMWASNAAPAVFSFLSNEKMKIKELHFVIKSEGAPADSTFAKLEEKICKLDFKYSIVTRLANEETELNRLIEALKD